MEEKCHEMATGCKCPCNESNPAITLESFRQWQRELCQKNWDWLYLQWSPDKNWVDRNTTGAPPPDNRYWPRYKYGDLG